MIPLVRTPLRPSHAAHLPCGRFDGELCAQAPSAASGGEQGSAGGSWVLARRWTRSVASALHSEPPLSSTASRRGKGKGKMAARLEPIRAHGTVRWPQAS